MRKSGLAETVDLGGLPEHDAGNGSDQEPAVVEPVGRSDDKEHHGKADDFDEVGDDKDPDGT